jgi:aryl-alcohol dehydrogenase-like predicted oxidoreductase
VIGLGTWQLGGRAYGAILERDAQAVVAAALDSGVRWFDTAPIYGDGAAEMILGDALAGRDDVQIITKTGYLSEGTSRQDFSVSAVLLSIEASLQRLQRDHVEYLLLHSPPRGLLLSGDPQQAVDAAVKAGLARHAGVSLASVRDLDLALAWEGCAAVEVICNLIDQRALDHDALVPLARRGTLVIARAPLCHGYLSHTSGGSKRLSSTDHRRRWAGEQDAAWRVASSRFSYLECPGRTRAQAAIAFCNGAPGIGLVIPGASNADQVRKNVAAIARRRELTPGERNRAREIGRALVRVAPDIRTS